MKAWRRHAIQSCEIQLVGAFVSRIFTKNRNRRVHRSVCGSARAWRGHALLLDWDEDRLRCPFVPWDPTENPSQDPTAKATQKENKSQNTEVKLTKRNKNFKIKKQVILKGCRLTWTQHTSIKLKQKTKTRNWSSIFFLPKSHLIWRKK